MILVLFPVERPRSPLGRTKDSREVRKQRCLFAKSYWSMHTRTVLGIYYFPYGVLSTSIFSFGVYMEAFDSKGIINTLKRYYVSHGMCWRCKFQFRYLTDKILFTLPVYFTREQNCRALLLKQVWRSEGKWNPCKLRAKNVLKYARITSLVGK